MSAMSTRTHSQRSPPPIRGSAPACATSPTRRRSRPCSRTALAGLGGLDVLVNNAGIAGPTAPVEAVDYADWRRCLLVNLDGAFLCARAAAPVLKAQRSGAIVNLSSTAGLYGFRNRTPYCAAKWGVIGLTKTLATELGPFGVRVNAICPGSVEGERMDRVVAAAAADERHHARGGAGRVRRSTAHGLLRPRRRTSRDDPVPVLAGRRAHLRPGDPGRRPHDLPQAEPMNFALTPEQEMVVATVRSFVENELYPLEAEVERTGRGAGRGRAGDHAQGAGAGLLRAQHPRGVRRRRARSPDLHAARARAGPRVLRAVGVLGAALQHPVRLQRASSASATCCRPCAASGSTASP